MYNLPTTTALHAVLSQPIDSDLKQLLADRLADTVACGFEEFTHVLVVEATDTEAAIVQAIGFSPLETRIDCGKGSLDCDWIERHVGWWELLYTVGNAGFAFILLVEDHPACRLARLARERGVDA